MTVLWIFLAVVIAACAIGVVVSRNPISSAVFLLVGFGGVAVLYIALKAEFVAAVQVLVYAGGIMVLYIFGIMFVDSELIRTQRQTHTQMWPAFLFAVILFAVLGHFLSRAEYKAPPPPEASFFLMTPAPGSAPGTAIPPPPPPIRRESNPVRVSRVLFSEFLYPFEMASILLTVAVLGGIFLAKKEV
jgi:NADH-quinone oxidoreductase subunit J